MGDTLTILKHAILMEKKGQSLYLKAMEHAQNDAVKAFFKDLADDEQEHVNILERQFRAFMAHGKFMAGHVENHGPAGHAPDILDGAVQKNISAAGFEAVAITAAIGFEEKAVRTYADQAAKTEDPEEKQLYTWLSAWEKTHLKKLTALEKLLMDQVWEDNHFWPM